jgi:hypothetical protein
MKLKTLFAVTIVLLLFVSVSCLASELSWANKEKSSDPLRQLIGFPSIAVGNLNPSARNPGLELLCTSILDSPGGYCNYWAPGVPFINFTMPGNITVSDDR